MESIAIEYIKYLENKLKSCTKKEGERYTNSLLDFSHFLGDTSEKLTALHDSALNIWNEYDKRMIEEEKTFKQENSFTYTGTEDLPF